MNRGKKDNATLIYIQLENTITQLMKKAMNHNIIKVQFNSDDLSEVC